MQTPILIVSDSPDVASGLARIARDIALHLCEMPEFRVGYCGKGGVGTCGLPFPVYQIPYDKHAPWGEAIIHTIAEDFFRGIDGIIFTVWDISRVGYIGWPQILADDVPSKAYLMRRPFRLWGYFPVDCVNIGNRLHHIFVEAYNRYDRTLFYTAWARDLATSSGVSRVDWIPHGLSKRIFSVPRPDTPSQLLSIGAVASNQVRKDWGLTFATVAWLKEKLGSCKLWAHVDRAYVPGRWNLISLAKQFGLHNDVLITTDLTDEQLWQNYAACDVTIGNGLGEGFGFPLAESLACGTPVVHGDYGGGADWMRQCGLSDCLVPPVAMRLESEFGSVRPVFRPEDFGEAVLKALALTPERCRESLAHLAWDKLWPSVWRKWFLRGLR